MNWSVHDKHVCENDWMCKTFPRMWKDCFSKTKFKFNGLGTGDISKIILKQIEVYELVIPTRN